MATNILNLADFDQIYPDSVDPVLSQAFNREVRAPNSRAVKDGLPNLHDPEGLIRTPFHEALSALGHPIEGVNIRNPLDDLEVTLSRLLRVARLAGDRSLNAVEQAPAQEAMEILLGQTQGKVYDGFALLNYNNTDGISPDHVAGQYKMKELQDTGETFTSQIDNKPHKLWEVTINMVWYGQNFDQDMFLLAIPAEVHNYDQLQIRWRIYSMIQEDLAPTTILNDAFGRIFHGLDSTFLSLAQDHLNEITIRYPSITNFRGLYNWGWGVHPPRIAFVQPVRRATQGGKNGWDPLSYSFVERNRNLTIQAIGSAAPEKKAYQVAHAALHGATGTDIARMLGDRSGSPRGIFTEWINLAKDQRQLPPEAWDMLRDEDGISSGEDLSSYDAVVVFMNNEMYGVSSAGQPNTEGKGEVIKDFAQGDLTRVKVINLDNHTHYYRNVDFGARVVDEIKKAFGNGKFSFEKFNVKPSYGVPKVIEMLWRTGWGFVPHRGIAKQAAVFPRAVDQLELTPFTDQFGVTHEGYLFKRTSDYWRFNPPGGIRAGFGHPDFTEPNEEPETDPINQARVPIEPGMPLRDADGVDGVKIGLDTEAFGIAQMPDEELTHHPDQTNFPSQTFPGFLRNPSSGGDIIPPTPPWRPYLALDPRTGELEDSESGGYWVDKTYLHGRPVFANSSFVATIEAPRASAQLFYNFDPLYHDNAIFSFHPASDTAR